MWTTYTAVIRGGPRLARRGTASRSLVATGPFEHVREVIGQWILERDLLTRYWMPEPEPPRVQEGPGEPDPHRLISPAPVGAVAQDRVSDRAQVHPDLVRPAGLRHRLHKRRARHPFAHLERRRCGAPVDPVDHDLRRPSAERSLHAEAVVRHLSADQREVAPVDRVMPERLAERSVGFVGLGDDEQAARSGVQSMNDPGPQFASSGSERDPHAEQPVDERAAPSAGGGMGHEPAWLRDDEQMSVLEHDGDRGPFGDERDLLGEVDDDLLATHQAE